MKIANLVGGLVIAVLLVVPFAVPRVAGIDTWKIILGIAGLMVFVRAGIDSK